MTNNAIINSLFPSTGTMARTKSEDSVQLLYPTFLESAFNGEAKRDGLDTMMVRVTINRTKTKAIDICRKWFFKSNGKTWTGEEEAVVREVVRDIPNSPRVDGKNGFHFSELLDEVFVPAHVAPFFFFDGEEVKKLADQSRVEQVKQGLEGLLGVVLLRSLPFHLVPKALTESYKAQLEAEVKWFAWEAEKRSLEPRKIEFQNAFASQGAPLIEPDLSKEQGQAIRARLDAAWDSLFYPPPEDCAEQITHDYLHETQRVQSLVFLASISLGQKEIKDLVNEQYSLQQRADELGRKISRLEGIDRDGTYKGLKTKLEEVTAHIERLAEQVRVNDRTMVTLPIAAAPISIGVRLRSPRRQHVRC